MRFESLFLILVLLLPVTLASNVNHSSLSAKESNVTVSPFVKEHVMWPLIRYTPALKWIFQHHYSKQLFETVQPIIPLVQDASFKQIFLYDPKNSNGKDIHALSDEMFKKMPLEKRKAWVNALTQVYYKFANDKPLLDEFLQKSGLQQMTFIFIVKDESKIRELLSKYLNVPLETQESKKIEKSKRKWDAKKDIAAKLNWVIMKTASLAAALGLANDRQRHPIKHDS